MQRTTALGFRGTGCPKILETTPESGDAQQNQPSRSMRPKFTVPLAASRRREVTAAAPCPPGPWCRRRSQRRPHPSSLPPAAAPCCWKEVIFINTLRPAPSAQPEGFSEGRFHVTVPWAAAPVPQPPHPWEPQLFPDPKNKQVGDSL